MPNQLIRQLRALNRKERYFVVAEATTGGFELSDTFREKLKMKNIPIDESCDKTNIFVAMDYHLDWIYASLFLANAGENIGPFPNNDQLITGTQEDIDLVVAFPDRDNFSHTHLVMIEAKGDTSWTNKQAESKATRLVEIFGNDGKQWRNVTPHYLVWSPRETSLDTNCFPAWAKAENKLRWMPLPMGDIQKLTRCMETGKASYAGEFWKIETLRGK